MEIEVLAAIASSNNECDIVHELNEYTRDINPGLAREAVKARLLLFLEVGGTGSEHIVAETVIQMKDLKALRSSFLAAALWAGSEHIVAETVIQMKDLLRHYPDTAEQLLGSSLAVSLRALVAETVIQMKDLLRHYPDLAKPFVETFNGEEPCVRLALLSSAAQLFFKRPAECQRLLGGLLSVAMNDTNQDVHDRALLYYRLLRTNVGEAERIISPPMMAVASFSESMTDETRNLIFKEFNTLSVVFQATASTFVDARIQYSERGLPGNRQHEFNTLSVVFQATASTFVDARSYHQLEEEVPVLATGNQGTAAEVADLLGDGVETTLLPASMADQGEVDLLDMGGAAPSAAGQGGGLLDLGDLLGGGGGPPSQPTAGQAGGGVDSLLGGDWGGAAPQSAPANNVFDLSGLGQAMPGAAGAGGGGGGGLIDFGDMMGMGAAPAGPRQSQAPAQVPGQLDFKLDPKALLSPPAFQERWKAMYPVHQYSQPVAAEVIQMMASNNHRDFTSHMSQASIMTMASGGSPPQYKYYFYGQASIMTMASGGSPPQYKYYFYGQTPGDGKLMLAELVVRTDTCTATVIFKSMHIEILPQFLERWQNCLLAFGF
eukprot:gene24470-10074_t